jgi:hypothetical protein
VNSTLKARFGRQPATVPIDLQAHTRVLPYVGRGAALDGGVEKDALTVVPEGVGVDEGLVVYRGGDSAGVGLT